MKPFQGIVRGRGRQPTTQLGDKRSGLVVEANAIDFGVHVECLVAGHNVVMKVLLVAKGRRELLAVIKNGEVLDE